MPIEPIGSLALECLVPKARPFWRYIADIPNNEVKTHYQYKKENTVSNKSFDIYF